MLTLVLPSTTQLNEGGTPRLASSVRVSDEKVSGSRIQSQLRGFFSNGFTQNLQKLAPWMMSGGLLGLGLVTQAPAFVIGSILAGVCVRTIKQIIKSNPLCQKVWKGLLNKAGIPEHKVPWFAMIMSGGLWAEMQSPAKAAFFVKAEAYATTLFTTGDASGANVFIPLIFGVLRIIFILYIGISLVRVVNAFRNDEDWTTAARIPLIVILCVVVGDALSTLIVEGGVAGAPGTGG